MADSDQTEKFAELRKRAEKLAEEQLSDIVYFSPEDCKKIIQDLRVHQIELELQNEELRVTQLKLETARHKYAELYDFSPVGLLTLDDHEHIEEANLTFVSLMGIDREKLVKGNLSDFIDSDSQDIYHLFFQSLRRGQQPQPCEITLLPATQIPVPVRLDGTSLVQADVQLTYRIAVSDITERRLAELERVRLHSAEQAAYTQAEHLAKRLAGLQRLTAALSEAVTPQQVVDVILSQSLDLLGASSLSLTLLSENEQLLETQHISSLPGDAIQAVQPVSVAEPSPLSDAIRTQQPVWLANVQTYQKQYPQLLPDLLSRRAVACLPLSVKEHKMGGIDIRFTQPQTFKPDQKIFILSMVGQCALALDRAQQAQQMAAVHERQWLANELHDSVTQSLYAASITAQSLLSQWGLKPEQAKVQVKDLVSLTQSALLEMRALLIELRPDAIIRSKIHTLLNQLGLATQGQRSYQLVLDIEESQVRLPDAVHIALYRIAQESINNVIKHSHATQLRISLHYQPQQITMEIEDNGQGFDLQHQTDGFGQYTIRERAETIGARLTIDSEPGKGTRISLLWKSPVPFILV